MLKTEFKNVDSALTASSDIYEFCKPLLKKGITYFNYLKQFEDGSQVNLSNSGLWLEHYYHLKLYKSSLFQFNPNNYKSGFFLWPAESDLEVFKHGRDYFNSDNGITAIEQRIGYTEFCFFSGSLRDHWLANFYINNLDFLNKFILFFKDRFSEVIKDAEENRIIICQSFRHLSVKSKKMLKSVLNEESYDYINPFDSQTIDNKLNSNQVFYPPANSASCLTKREINVAVCLLQGKTAKETGKKLYISPRTVEQYIENMREKFNCKNKVQLANILLNTFPEMNEWSQR